MLVKMFYFLLSVYFFILANASIIHPLRSPITIPLLYDNADGGFYAQITMGTPPQHFNAVIDIQNSHFWVISDKCNPDVCLSPYCRMFESERSLTFTTTGKKVEFIGSNITNEGYISMDVTRIGDIVLEDQVFIEASAVNDGIYPSVLSAVLGLAPGENSSPKIKTLTEAMIDSKIATRFTLSIDAVKGTRQLVFDSPDDSIRNQATAIPLSDPNKWQFNSDRINIGNLTLCETECKVNVDSRIYDILFPINIAEKLAKTVHGHYDPKVQAVLFPRKEIRNIPNLDIKVNNQILSFHNRDYDDCFLMYDDFCALHLGPSKTEWVLGRPLLAKFDIEFNFRDKTLNFTPKA